MAIQGLRHTANFVVNQRPENWRQGILLLNPNGMAPLTALTNVMKSESTDDPVFHWWEKELDDRRVVLGAAIDASQTTFTVVENALILKGGDLLFSEQTKEIVRVTMDPASDVAVEVQRAFGNTTGTAITYNGVGINPNWVVIGSAFEEGSTAPTGVNYDPNEKSNYTQIFRSTLEMTRTATKTRLRTGDAVREAKRECLEYFSIDMERAFWFGKKSSTTHNGKPLRTTNGVYHTILELAPANMIPYAATPLDMDTLMANLEVVFRKGSNEKMGYGGNLSLLTIQECVRKNSTWNIQNGMKEYGMEVTRIVTPFGTLVLKTHPLWNQMIGGTNAGSNAYTGMNSTLAILDMANFKYRYIDDVKYEKDLAQTGLDGMKSGYIAECGMEIHHAETHHWWTGLTSAAVDTP